MRTENDTWDINSSVGVTALAVAASRVGESAAPDSLVSDPFAAAFVAVAAARPTTPTATCRSPANCSPTSASRTRFFDEFFAERRRSRRSNRR